MFESNFERPIEDHEYPDEYDADDQWDETAEASCPACGAMIDADSVRCPVCGDYITPVTSNIRGGMWWCVAVGLLALFAASVLISAL